MRPEVRALLLRWREALVGVGIAGFGLFWALTTFGALQWLGWTLVAGGAALVVTGVQRGRFRRSGIGPGIVTIDERRVVFFGPEEGGVADLDLLARLELMPEGPSWRLIMQDGVRLSIPVNATGADQLFDVFAALPGVRLEAMLAHLGAPGDQVHTIWEAPSRRLT